VGIFPFYPAYFYHFFVVVFMVVFISTRKQLKQQIATLTSEKNALLAQIEQIAIIDGGKE